MDDGVWRTVSGRRIFIKDGQSLTDAMRDSGKFSSKSRFKNGYGKTNTEESLGEDSLKKYMDKDGNLIPEREKLHKKLIDEAFEGKTPVSDEEKTFYMTGGGSGTGKSNIVKNPEEYLNYSKNTVVVDSDAIKLKFPDYDENDITSAAYFHEESSALTKRIINLAQENSYNVMLDGTGDGSVKGVLKKIQKAKENGYKVVAGYGTCAEELGQQRNEKRYEDLLKAGKPARYVSPSTVRKTHKEVSKILPEVASEFDRVELYDFNDFKNIKHIATGGSGKGLKPMKEFGKEYNEFLEKANLPEWEE